MLLSIWQIYYKDLFLYSKIQIDPLCGALRPEDAIWRPCLLEVDLKCYPYRGLGTLEGEVWRNGRCWALFITYLELPLHKFHVLLPVAHIQGP